MKDYAELAMSDTGMDFSSPAMVVTGHDVKVA